MQIQRLTINNIRGVRHMSLVPGGNNFVIWGPNGSGKSAVVDAIDFLLTGRITRLTGEGTGAITLNRHGPHVDSSTDDASVSADVTYEDVQGVVEIERSMSGSKLLDYPEAARRQVLVTCALAELGQLILTRKALLGFIASDGRRRGERMDQLLNLESVRATRSALVTASNIAARSHEADLAAIERVTEEITALVIGGELTEVALIETVNTHRRVLGATNLDRIDSGTVKTGVVEPTVSSVRPFNRTVFSNNLRAITEAVEPSQIETRTLASDQLVARLTRLDAEPELVIALKHAELLDRGIGLVDESSVNCPLCDLPWGPGELLAHLQEKARDASAARTLSEEIRSSADQIKSDALQAKSRADAIVNEAELLPEGTFLETDLQEIRAWGERLQELNRAIENPDPSYLRVVSERKFDVPRLLITSEIGDVFTRLSDKVEEVATQSTPAQESWDALTRFDDRFKARRTLRSQAERSGQLGQRAETLLAIYEDARNSILEALWDRVSGRFTELYASLHPEETDAFEANITQDQAAVGLEVDFYGRGSFPPHALHSEGHQDSMGLCLFLALQEEFDPGGSIPCVLDDVVMSVDSGHRRFVCDLLNREYPDKQFIITTHDENWMRQLRSTGVVQSGNIVGFSNWSPEFGPTVHNTLSDWERIDSALDGEDVNTAAFFLRRHAEETFEIVCDSLQADIRYNSGHMWELGDWIGGAMEAFKEVLRKGRSAAISWGNDESLGLVEQHEADRTRLRAATFADQWAVNAAVHYNSWENLQASELAPIVMAFKELEKLLRCQTCNSFLTVETRDGVQSRVSCTCGEINWGLIRQRA